MNTDQKKREKKIGRNTALYILNQKEELLDVILIYNIFPEQTKWKEP